MDNKKKAVVLEKLEQQLLEETNKKKRKRSDSSSVIYVDNNDQWRANSASLSFPNLSFPNHETPRMISNCGGDSSSTIINPIIAKEIIKDKSNATLFHEKSINGGPICPQGISDGQTQLTNTNTVRDEFDQAIDSIIIANDSVATATVTDDVATRTADVMTVTALNCALLDEGSMKTDHTADDVSGAISNIDQNQSPGSTLVANPMPLVLFNKNLDVPFFPTKVTVSATTNAPADNKTNGDVFNSLLQQWVDLEKIETFNENNDNLTTRTAYKLRSRSQSSSSPTHLQQSSSVAQPTLNSSGLSAYSNVASTGRIVNLAATTSMSNVSAHPITASTTADEAAIISTNTSCTSSSSFTINNKTPSEIQIQNFTNQLTELSLQAKSFGIHFQDIATILDKTVCFSIQAYKKSKN